MPVYISDRITPFQIFLKLLALDVAVVAHPEDKIASVGAGDLPQAIDTDARILGCFLEVENCFFPHGDVDHIIFGLGEFLLSLSRGSALWPSSVSWISGLMLFFLHLSFDFYLRLFRCQHGLNLGIQSVLDSIGNADLTAQAGEDGFVLL